MALPKLLRLPFRTDIGDGQWIELDEFISFLRQYHSPSDKIKKVKRSNIISEFKTHQVSLKEKDGILYITITSVLRYIFHHYDQQAICRECVHEIQQKISSEKTQAPCTVEEIYKRITNLAFRSSVIENHIFQNIDINETDIPSLYIQYKTDFSNVEWTKICYFEFHFCKRLEDLPVNYEYEYLIKKRLEFINEIETTNTVAQIAAKASRQLITERTKRKNIAIGNEDITIHVGKKHLPKVIETQILEEFCDCGINSVLCHECLKSCQHTKSVHLYVELQQNILEDVNTISEAITNFLANRHELTCAEILFLKQDTFLPYNDSLGRPYRYRFREDLLTMKRNDEILHHWTNSNISDIEIPLDGNNVGNCSSCYTLSIHKPLSWQSFHVLQEWTLDVPLIEQIILEKFININSVKKTGNLEVLLKNKFTRLYTAYDILLNLSNRLYTGVLQDLNSQELALNFQSVSTVFSVTQSSGATLSLNESERRLKEMANEDQCYYNTYLRKYDLEYYTEAGLCKKNINLKDCHLILFMDNLVRLKFRADPCPGESRALQLCTLPITLKGIPKDSLTVASWHGADCEGQDECNCKKERKLTKEDFQKELTNLSANECKMVNSFKKLLSWGFDILWLSIINGEAPDLYDQMSMGPDVEPLEASFASLNLESHNPMEETDLDDTIDYEPPLALNPEQFGDSLINEDDSEEMFVDKCDGNSVSGNDETYATDEESLPEISDIDSIDDRDFDDDQDSEDGSLLDNLLDEVDLLQIHDIQGFNDENDLDCFQVLNETQDDELQSSGDNTEIIQTTQLTTDETSEAAQTSLLEDLGFIQYKPPSLLTRHPPPATGRDDDLVNIRKVLDDILIKSEHSDESCVRFNKILFGPDNKIGNILLKLIAQNKKYKVFLPEFPLLHLRKSKINTVCSAYSKAGILHILKYMRDDDYKEWKKLISDDHIEQATRYIKRLSLAFHIAFMCRYLQTLDSDESKRICKLLASGKMPETEFESGYDAFIEAGCKENATFCLHKEMMDHFDEIAAIALAERLGGEDGYCLLLSAVKNSLPLAFLNGASSYAAYCVNLLYNHFVSGPFYQNMKCSLFTTPHKGSIVNIALDAQREMDHKDVIKSFRSGSTMSSILPRMSLIDTLNQASNCSKRSLVMSDAGQDDQKVDERKILGISLNKTDVTYITRIATLILRQDGLSIKQDEIPYNVYSNPKSQLPISILDRHTVDVGKYLIQKYLCTSGLFQCSKNDTPSMQDLTGPKQLLQKVKSSKGVTIKRISSANTQTAKSEKERIEQKRRTAVKRETKKIDCISSEMNACQAILKPDCSKPKVLKSTGIQKAIIQLTAKSLCMLDGHLQEEIQDNGIIKIAENVLPDSIRSEVKLATVEFAGVKFKAKVFSGDDYLDFVKNYVIQKTINQMPNISRMVICEEKYHFTPDDFKAATRAQRTSSANVGISHLKTVDEMISANRFDKASLVSTAEGKSFISTYLARRIDELNLYMDLTLIIDSEYYKEDGYTTPIQCLLGKKEGLKSKTQMVNIKQRKGEAEMAQLDWLLEFADKLEQGDGCASIVTSGDIDAVVIHLFTLSFLWPRSQDGTFKNDVYVVLQKAGSLMDIYNITKIIEILEKAWKEKYIAAKVAIALSLGGNDFLPKFHNITHSKTLEVFLQEKFRKSLINVEIIGSAPTVKFNNAIYVDFVKTLYCSKKEKTEQLSFEEVRKITMKFPSSKKEGKLKNPQLWMPPASALLKLATNVQCLIDYYLTAGYHNKDLPDFISKGCLKKTQAGEIEFDLGEESKILNIETIWKTSENTFTVPTDPIALGKRKSTETPQKGRRRKQKPVASTPKKTDIP